MIETAQKGFVRGANFDEFRGWATCFPQSLTGERAALGMPAES